MRPLLAVLASLALLAAGCGDDGGSPEPDAGPRDAAADAEADGAVDSGVDAGPFEPDGYCPGGPGCVDEGDGVLHAGAAAVAITPTIDESTETQTVDMDGDGEYDPGDGDEFEDVDGDGTFDGEWLAGFGNGRAASGVENEQWVRSIALRYGETTIVLASIDCIGYFYDEIAMIREMVSDLDVDYVMMSATHSHEARDTLGIYGVDQFSSGIDPGYMAFVREQAAESIRQAVADLRPANVQYNAFRMRDRPGGMLRYQGDARDPKIVDDEVRVMRFFEPESEDTIATFVNWGSHPEYTGDTNQRLSSDYPHWIREGIENGVMGPDGMVEGVGGVAVFYQGALGGQIGPNSVELQTFDGTPVDDEGHDAARNVGTKVAYFVLQALGPDGGSVTDETAALGYRNQVFFVDVQNRGYHIALLGELFKRGTYNWDPDSVLSPENEPDIQTEIAVIDIGRTQLVTVPGELHPELFIGGYDGAHTPAGQEIVDPGNENPPDLSAAPEGPYLRDLARDDADYVVPMGLGNDMLGYLVPAYNYVLHPTNPYLDEPEGDHYEETNSVGVDGWPEIRSRIEQLLAWSPDGG